MKKYQIHVIGSDGIIPYTVFAQYFSESRTSSGYYAFYDGKELISCYPISRTIIVSIENADEL